MDSSGASFTSREGSQVAAPRDRSTRRLLCGLACSLSRQALCQSRSDPDPTALRSTQRLLPLARFFTGCASMKHFNFELICALE